MAVIDPVISEAPLRRRTQWQRGLRYLRALMKEPDATANALDLQFALGGRDLEAGFQHMLRDPGGRLLLAERPDLLAVVSDRARLAAMPPQSVGRALLDYFDRFGFDPASLVALWREVQDRWEREEGEPRVDPARAWFGERSLLLHDLFHVLSGYDADQVGEASLLGFSLGQLPGRVNRLLTLGASLEVMRVLGVAWLPYVYTAWRRGRRAVWLYALPWEELLARPLAEVREEANLEAPERVHPRGVLRGRIDDLAKVRAA